jgi:hypothetical protein
MFFADTMALFMVLDTMKISCGTNTSALRMVWVESIGWSAQTVQNPDENAPSFFGGLQINGSSENSRGRNLSFGFSTVCGYVGYAVGSSMLPGKLLSYDKATFLRTSMRK